MHGKLKSDLISGYLQNEHNIIQWKEQFKVYCKIKKVKDGTIDGHFDFLEERGKIKIGDYEVLKNMFRHFDLTAIEEIDNASREIRRALQNNKNKS